MTKFKLWLTAAVLAIVGAALLIGGVTLVAHGGSAYYVIAGLAVLIAAIGVVRGARYAAFVYGAMLAGTILWSLWEVGLDAWPLMPRLIAPVVLGLLFLLPGIHRAVGASRWWIGGPALLVLLIMSIAIVRLQTAESGLPSAAKVTALPDAPKDWRHWGNTLAGTRYAAIDQINLDNVGQLQLAWRYDSDVPPGALVSLEAAPLAVDGRLYMCIESGTVAALDQDTGKRLWQYRGLPEKSPFLGWKCRGVAYYVAKSSRLRHRDVL